MDEQAFITEAIKRGIVTFAQIQECLQVPQREKIWDMIVQRGWATRLQVSEILEGKPPVKILAFGPFQLLEKLGEGGMGVVYRAKKHDSDRPVAIKILPERFTNSEGAKRFEREAKAAIAISHPHIVKGYEFGAVNNRLFYSMELVEGRVVGAILDERGPMDELSVLRIGLQIAQALDAIHRRGLVHRDVKPDNMIVTAEGIVKLMDLGLIKSTLPGATVVTQPGHTLGSPHYIAPERVLGTGEDIRSDVYSLGASLYHMITGAAPFDATITMDILRKQIAGVPLDDPRVLRPEISQGLRDVVEKMMARAPVDRHASPKEVVADLGELIEGRPPKSPPLPPGRSIVRRGRMKPRHLLPVSIGVGSAALLAGLLFLLIPGGSDPEEPAGRKARRELQALIRSGAFNDALSLVERESSLAASEPEVRKAAMRAWKESEESVRSLPYDKARAEMERFRLRCHRLADVDVEIERALAGLAIAEREEEAKRDAERRFDMLADSILDLEAQGKIDEALAILKRARTRAEDSPLLASMIDGRIRQLERIRPDPRSTADRLFAEAQSALDSGALDLAAAKLDVARTAYVAAGAADRIEACIRMAESIRNRRAPTAVQPEKKPEPPPPPEPPKVPPQSSPAIGAIVTVLKDLAAGGTLTDARSTARALIRDASTRDGRIEAFAYLVHRTEQDSEWLDESERRALADYFSRVDWARFESMEIAEHATILAALKADRSTRASECLLLFEFMHLNRILQLNRAHADLLSLAKERGLVSIDLPRGLCFATPAGLEISRSDKVDLAELRKIGSINDPYFSLYRTWRELLHFGGLSIEEKKKRAAEMSRMLREAKPPAGFRDLFKNLAGKIKAPCRGCGGSGSIDCRSCEEGEIRLVCGTCNGWGGVEQYPCGNCQGKDCGTCRGRGFVFARPCRACEEKGRWKEPCTKCAGAGKLDDPQCKEPWAEPVLSSLVAPSPCRTCRQTGLVFERVFLPCADCGGLGQVIAEKDR